jgi:hypothetical protein
MSKNFKSYWRENVVLNNDDEANEKRFAAQRNELERILETCADGVKAIFNHKRKRKLS